VFALCCFSSSRVAEIQCWSSFFGILWGLFAVVALRGPNVEGRQAPTDESRDSHRPNEIDLASDRLKLALAVFLIGIALFVLWLTVWRSDGWLFISMSGVLFGAGRLVSAARSSNWKWWDVKRGLFLIAGSVAAFLIGLLIISPGRTSTPFLLLGLAVLVSPVGLSWLSGDILRRIRPPNPRQRPSRRFLLVSGGVLIAGSLVWLLWIGVAPIIVGLAAIVIFFMVGAIASDTSVDIAVVVAALALIWSFTPRGVPASSAITPADGDSVIVALGDSYMSGEGAKEFFDGTNNRGKNRNECRRAPTAYAPLLAELDDPALPHKVVFLACSGARAEHIDQVPQYEGDPIRTDGSEGPGLDQLDQWRLLTKTLHFDVRLVIVTIGGNDALFGEVGRICVFPGDCAQVGAEWLENLQTSVAPNVAAAYRNIRHEFPDVPILAVPYPIPLRDRKCNWSALSNDEHRFLHGFVQQLDHVLEIAAKNEGLYYLKEGETALKDRNLRICDQGPGSVGVNFLASNPIGGASSDTLNPRNWFHNSLHPNLLGHEAMRDTLVAWIKSHPGPPPAQPASVPAQQDVASIDDIMGVGFRHCASPGARPAHCDGDSEDWALAQILGFVWLSVIPFLLFVAGAWFLWLEVIRSEWIQRPIRGLIDRGMKADARNRQQLRSVLAGLRRRLIRR
jgi:lysophospholipase L1-like esterase